MSPLHWLSHYYPWAVPILLIGGGVLYSCLFTVFARKIVGHARLSANNEVAGFKYAVQGVTYSVLLAFVVVVVWDEYRGAEQAARQEAKAAVDLYRLIGVFTAGDAAGMQRAIRDYVISVKDVEWSTMIDGLPNPQTSAAFQAMAGQLLGSKPTSLQEFAVYQRALDLIGQLSDNRRERLESAVGNIPGILWFVLFIGAAITLAYPAFFSQQNFVPQIWMTITLALTITLIMYAIVALDFPFSGAAAIEPVFFEKSLKVMS